MNIKTRTSLISIAISSILTLFKFILYFLSGSVAILSEAWHSFSDIGTSFLVFLAVKERKPSKEASQEPKSSPSRVHPEHKVSLTIGFFLLFVSIMLLLRIIAVKMVIIYKPLFCGILFIIFSIGSYFLYRFKTTVGESEKSAALISDGLHSKADMISALLTGFSLIIYRFGGNLDRFVGGIIALFIFSFAIETLVNVTSAHIKRDEEYVIKYKSYQIFEHVFKKDTFSRLIQLIESKLNWPLTKTKPYYLLPKLVKPGLIGLVILGLLGYLSTMLVIVGADEEAIIERFGRPLNRERALQPGLHLKLPWPIDRVCKLKTREIKQINLGNVTDPGNFALLWTRPHGEEMHFLGGDNNFFNPYIVLHYRVNNIFDFLSAILTIKPNVRLKLASQIWICPKKSPSRFSPRSWTPS